MSSRQEEKERRKREREEREAAEKASAARRKRMQIVFGGVLGRAGRGRGRRRSVVGRRSAAATTATAEVAGGRARRSRRSRRPTSRRPPRPRAARSWTPPNEGAGHEEKDFKAVRLQAEPADLGQPLPAVVPGRHLRARATRRSSASSCTRSSTAASTSSTSRARPPTTVAQLETLYQGERRRLPHAALPERARRCRSRSPRPPGTTSSAARR